MRTGSPASGSSRDYKRGAVMGLTVAEAFILLSFILLLLFTWWQVDSEKRSLHLADSLGEMTDAQKAEILDGLTDGTFELARALREAGLGRMDQAALEDTSNYSRFMREEDLQRLLTGAVELLPGTRLKLSEVIEITPETRLRAALDDLLSPEAVIDGASQRLADAAREEEDLVNMLERELGASIREAGGAIRADGTIILPQNVLFEVNSDQIKDVGFLKDFCAPWVRTLRSSGLDVTDLKIEGHASSEGPSGYDASRAYLYNLNLSQRRAQNALTVCLSGLETDPDTLDWARGRLSATGYSSARLVENEDGMENREASRRVEFSMDIDREKLLDEVREDLRRGADADVLDPIGVAGAKAPGSSDQPTSLDGGAPPQASEPDTMGHPRVIDGDTIAIGERRWRLFGIDAPERTQKCSRQSGERFSCGIEATEALIRLIGTKEVRCAEIEKDRYGRSVGTCFVGETDIGREMVRTGMARAYLKYSHEYEAEGLAAENGKVGFWAGQFQSPEDFR
ncbi:thermonuclease family protein [Pseudogemmobacter bohemicus]|uniref:thermonuclease family protein n=1 Tax=Pseudogemmobacter bohemicus TaxID=2250708 RepID=UPI0013007BE3|nr:thermonuclease family protein [Pseudogemmobacter bohemicus]